MDPSSLKKMLHAASGKVQSGIVAWGSLHDYESYKDVFKGSYYQAALEDAMDGVISAFPLQQCTSSKPKPPLIIPVNHCLNSAKRFSSVLKKLSDGKYDGPFVFLPSSDLYDPYNA